VWDRKRQTRSGANFQIAETLKEGTVWLPKNRVNMPWGSAGSETRSARESSRPLLRYPERPVKERHQRDHRIDKLLP
jgi:hypothetical protein